MAFASLRTSRASPCSRLPDFGLPISERWWTCSRWGLRTLSCRSLSWVGRLRGRARFSGLMMLDNHNPNHKHFTVIHSLPCIHIHQFIHSLKTFSPCFAASFYKPGNLGSEIWVTSQGHIAIKGQRWDLNCTFWPGIPFSVPFCHAVSLCMWIYPEKEIALMPQDNSLLYTHVSEVLS